MSTLTPSQALTTLKNNNELTQKLPKSKNRNTTNKESSVNKPQKTNIPRLQQNEEVGKLREVEKKNKEARDFLSEEFDNRQEKQLVQERAKKIDKEKQKEQQLEIKNSQEKIHKENEKKQITQMYIFVFF